MRFGKPTLAQEAYGTLKDVVITGAWKTNEMFGERELADRFGLGKTPIREALHALQQEGLVEAIPRAGYLVRPITVRSIRELLQVRLILEPAAVELAAGNASESELGEIQELANISYTFGDQESYRAFLKLNTRFHHRVALASGNEQLAEMVLGVLEKLERALQIELDLGDHAEEMKSDHRDLVAALIDRDPDRARAISSREIESSRDRMLAANLVARQVR